MLFLKNKEKYVKKSQNIVNTSKQTSMQNLELFSLAMFNFGQKSHTHITVRVREMEGNEKEKVFRFQIFWGWHLCE